MRYYDIDEINNKKPSHSKWLPLILTVIFIVLMAALLYFGIDYAHKKATESLQIEEDRMIEQAREETDEMDLAGALHKSAVSKAADAQKLDTYTISEIRKMDLSKPSGVTVADLKLVTKGNFVGLEDAFYKAEQDYGINCLFLMAIGANESAYGTICFRKNNMFGFGRQGYATKADNIDTVARTLATKYLKPGASLYHGSTIDGVHKRYAASPVWDDHVAKYMSLFYSKIAPAHNKAVENLKN